MPKEVARTEDVAPATIVNEYPLAAQLRIGDRITDAGGWSEHEFIVELLKVDKLADVNKVFAATSTEEVFNVPLVLRGVRMAPSRFANSRLGFYCYVDAVRKDDGEILNVRCGAETPSVTLLRALEQGWFPFDAHFEAANETQAGFQPINLVVDGPDF